jgi:protein-tyrosine phosphatase
MSEPGPQTALPWSPESTHLRVGATTNLRDLGGVPTADGRVIGRGRIYRAEALVRPGASTTCAIWDEAHADAYQALGIGTVLDLRSAAEQERAPSAWPVATGAEHVAIPIEEGGEGDTDYVRQIREGQRTTFSVTEMAGYYGLILRNRPAEFGAALRVIADSGRLPVLIHCAAGKDRTGLLVALLLETLRVPRQVVVAEYALTGTLRPNRVAAYAHLFGDSGVNLADIAVLFDAPAEVMAGALAGLDAEFGSVRAYLQRECGITTKELGSLEVNLLVPA